MTQPPKEREDGGPAFPFEYDAPSIWGEGPGERAAPIGMSLRDWFAGQAMASFVQRHGHGLRPEMVAQESFEVADAMLEARDAVQSE